MHRHIPEYNKKNVRIARLLRRNMTDAERKLWSSLRNNQLGVKFRRQVPFGVYVLDFYCPKAKLNVELDGSQHYTEAGRQEDAERDRYLRERGVEILRFSNIEFLQNEYGVLQAIFEKVQDRAQPQSPSKPSPKWRRGS
jgi:very-short-patch-repair endonuclease